MWVWVYFPSSLQINVRASLVLSSDGVFLIDRELPHSNVRVETRLPLIAFRGRGERRKHPQAQAFG